MARRVCIVERATVSASQQAVWAVVADPSTHTEWRPALEEFRLLSPPPLAVGSSIREVVRFGGRRLELSDSVTRLEAPSVLGIEGESASTAFGLELRLEAVGEGTLVTFDWWLEARSGLLRLAAPLLHGTLRRATAEELRLLGAYVERGGSGTKPLVDRWYSA